MQTYFKTVALVIICFLANISFAATKFVAGVDYQEIKPAVTSENTKQVQVVEFFSYGCPVCFRVEPEIEKWQQVIPKKVKFSRVPVVFESGWGTYAKAYYVANAYNVADKITPKIFNAIHNDRQNLSSPDAMKRLFVGEGVTAEDFDSAFNYSPTIDAEVKQGMQLMRTYGILSVPTIVIDGRYKTDLQLAKGDPKRMMEIVDFLIAKSK